jgi:fluoride ion exporter CrcB/FEX
MVEWIWLAAMLGGLAAWTVRGQRQYAAFKGLTDTGARCAFYWRWTWESFVLLTGASVVTLLMLGQTRAPFETPAAFRALAAQLTSAKAAPSSPDGSLGFAIGLCVGIGLLILPQVLRMRKAVQAVAGDIEPLLPRNGLERLMAVPLSLNAGFSEELFFRLALPLLIAHLTGSAVAGFVVAGVAFGLAHAYQGWKGVLATGFVGGLLTVSYLGKGLVWVMAIHAVIDLVALLVRPAIAGWFARGRGPATA